MPQRENRKRYSRPLAKPKKWCKIKHMKYKNLKQYTDAQFKRITGVSRKTFGKMLEILKPKHELKLSRGGIKPKLLLEEMLLAALEYCREARYS
ncbi:MAG: mobile genetic element [Candidatus Improbicoccus devescovinae]|nr:MAG: mobile genetic element [Candidatus Improbicoccus devescovinae]